MEFVLYNKLSEVLKPGKEPFNFPTAPIKTQRLSILGYWFLSCFSIWRDHFNIVLIKRSLIKIIAVVSLVTDQFVRSVFGKATIYSRFDQFYFIGRSVFNESGGRNTRSVCNCRDPGAFAALCLSDCKTLIFPVRRSRR